MFEACSPQTRVATGTTSGIASWTTVVPGGSVNLNQFQGLFFFHDELEEA